MTATALLPLLVPTKITPPRAQPSWVLRNRLLDQLDTQPDARLLLLVAPAGFGKTTLIVQWLHRHVQQRARQLAAPVATADQPSVLAVAWLTLDEHDQDGLRFLAYLAGAITRIIPDALPTTMPFFAARETPPIHVVIQSLLVDMNRIAQGLTIVLDDYHLVVHDTIHQTVSYILRNLPPGWRLAILSRIDPPLPLARWRAEGALIEIRATDLRFSLDEASDLLALGQSSAPTASLVKTIHEQTEGWAIALQLAALAQSRVLERHLAFDLASRQIAEYLAAEVFAQQTPDIQMALMTLSVPERFCVELYTELLTSAAAQQRAESHFEHLQRSNLLIALDGEGRWFRFHHLLRDLLQRRLTLASSEQAVRALEGSAARWFAAQGLIEEAIRLFLRAGDEESAATVVESNLFSDLNLSAPKGLTSHYLCLLPQSLVERRPGLGILTMRIASTTVDIPVLEATIAHIDQLLLDEPPSYDVALTRAYLTELQAQRGALAFWQGRADEAIAYLQAALSQEPNLLIAVQAFLHLAQAFVMQGRYEEGLQAVSTGIPSIAQIPALGSRVMRVLGRCVMHLLAGEFDALERDARSFAELVTTRQLGDLWVAYAEVMLGRVAYERSDLAAAAKHFGAVVERKYQANSPTYLSSVIGLSLIAVAQHALADAVAYEQEARAFAAETGSVFLQNQALACAIHIAHAQGNSAAMVRYASEIRPDIHLAASFWLETPLLRRVQALTRAADALSLQQAESALNDIDVQVQSGHNARLRVAVLIHRALLRQAQQRHTEARTELEQALLLAQPYRFVRTFLDQGPALHPLLHALSEEGRCAPYARRLLASAQINNTVDGYATVASRQQFPEMLTRRETEILSLLAERLSNQEIASQLVVTINTVRKHTSTIYDKLGVRSRREAVATARALGLLKP